MTEYSFQQDPYLEGSLQGDGPKEIFTVIASETVYPGQAVKRDVTNTERIVAWSVAGAYANVTVAGVVVRTSGIINGFEPNVLDGSYKAGQAVPIAVTTQMAVKAVVDVKTGDPVYNVKATGEFTNVATDNGIKIGLFLDTVTAGNLSNIRLTI